MSSACALCEADEEEEHVRMLQSAGAFIYEAIPPEKKDDSLWHVCLHLSVPDVFSV